MVSTLRSAARTVRLAGGVALAVALVAGGLAVGSSSAVAVGSTCPHADYEDQIGGAADFNFDEFMDVTYPQPSRRVDGKLDAGAVVVAESCIGTVTLTSANTGLGPAVAGGRFGAFADVMHFDQDIYDDLVIGAPGQRSTGAVVVVFGSADGLNRGQAARRISVPGLHDGDRFGTDVRFGTNTAPVDPNNDSDNEPIPGPDTLHMLVGAPGTDVSAAKDAGVVHELTLENQPYRLVRSTRWIQGHGGLPGKAETGDRFGEVIVSGSSFNKDNDEFALTDVTLIGVPHEDVGKAKDAGTVYAVPALNRALAKSLSQSTRGVPGVAHANEHFGAAAVSAHWSKGGFYVGTPGDDIGSATHAGSVQHVRVDRPVYKSQQISMSAKGLLTQNTRGVPDKAEKGDHFGSALALVGSYGAPDLLAVGVPDENVGTAVDAGAVTTIPTSGTCGKRCTTRTQNTKGEPGTAEKGDHYGASLTPITDRRYDANDGSSAMVGVPGEDVGARHDVGAIADSTRNTNGKLEFSPIHTGTVAGTRIGEVAPLVWG